MSQYWKITLTPLDAYFLGGERNARFENSQVQLSERRPYFIRSNRMLSQSAAFGVLRYLGIKSPQPDFSLTQEDKDNVGTASYSLTENRDNFGRICQISPVLLTDGQNRFVPAPVNRGGTGTDHRFVPFSQYTPMETLDGIRYLPGEYREKEACNPSELLCLESGNLIQSPFQSQVRTGINRVSQRQAEAGKANENAPSGFFKKEYVVLKSPYAFLFYAETGEDFFVHRDTVVYVGQGRTPFAAHVEELKEKWSMKLPAACFPKNRTWESATVLSDLCFQGHTRDLKAQCSLMIANPRNHRCMETNYDASHAGERYKKKDALKLIPAGSVFLFCGEDRKEKLKTFREYIEKYQLQKRAEIAGFNCLAYSEDTTNGGK